jgi:hypothetical protein
MGKPFLDLEPEIKQPEEIDPWTQVEPDIDPWTQVEPEETFPQYLRRVMRGECTEEEAKWVKGWIEDDSVNSYLPYDIDPPKKKPSKPRDRMAEHIKTSQRRAATVMELRRQREDEEWGDLLMVAQALLVCGLPYRQTNERQITMKAKLAGDTVSVTFTCCLQEVPMPYGSDRTLLHWLVDRAIRSEKPYVSWDTATEFIKDAGLSDHGKNFRDLRERFRRISGVAISIVREREGREKTLIIPIVEESTLPSSVDMKSERRGLRRLLGEKFGVTLNARFWKEIREHHVPVPWQLIRSTRKQSQLQDHILFLYWRSYAAKAPSLVPWSGIEDQSAGTDSNPRRLKQRYKEALRTIRVIDPSFPGEIQENGIQIEPYQGFLKSGESRKRLK